MKNLDYILKSENFKIQKEKERIERIEQFKGIRKQEREKTCKILQSIIYQNATLDNEYIHIKRNVFDKIIEEIKGE